ncbi:MAG: radical SAM protein, partial [Candidatus Omnitrophica bacterium]|nr:radical SAM protein [Candidatus Omnitrophota bacterium]
IGEYEYTVLDILKGKDPKEILGLYPNPRRPLLDINDLPFPEDEDISRWDYIGIEGSEYKQIEMFASRGCFMSCVFCVCRHLYYAQPNWRPRNIENIIAEIKYLRNKYPQMEGIFFNEEEHNGNKNFIINLTKAIKENSLADLKYEAMCGYWTLDYQMLKAMKDAGYYKLRIGVETASQIVAKGINKKIDILRLKEILRIAKDIGLKIYATFIFGAPGATKAEDLKTVRLIEELLRKELISDLQVSICTPQPGTPFYYWSEKNGYLVDNNCRNYDGLQCAVISYPNYSKEEIEEIFKLAYQLYRERQRERQIRKMGIKNFLREKINKEGVFNTVLKGLEKIKREIDFRYK